MAYNLQDQNFEKSFGNKHQCEGKIFEKTSEKKQLLE